jgi:hypothetical protein
MSINGWILEQVKQGLLFPVLPKARNAARLRALLVTREVDELLNSPTGDQAWELRIANLQADLERFVSGRSINPKYLFLLYPLRDAVWEIRSVGDDPSIRVLGSFAYKDIFVATTYALREDLGGWQSREWKLIKRRAAAKWRSVFPSYDPVPGHDVKKLVSGALDGKYFKTARKK